MPGKHSATLLPSTLPGGELIFVSLIMKEGKVGEFLSAPKALVHAILLWFPYRLAQINYFIITSFIPPTVRQLSQSFITHYNSVPVPA